MYILLQLLNINTFKAGLIQFFFLTYNKLCQKIAPSLQCATRAINESFGTP